VPSLYGAGYAKSDFTTCLPALERCWGPIGRSENAVFGDLSFGELVYLAVLHLPQHRQGLPKQEKCGSKVQPISNEKCADQVRLRRMKNEE
jgi:hypothetical protein